MFSECGARLLTIAAQGCRQGNENWTATAEENLLWRCHKCPNYRVCPQVAGEHMHRKRQDDHVCQSGALVCLDVGVVSDA